MSTKHVKSSGELSDPLRQLYNIGKVTCFLLTALANPFTYAQEWTYPGWEETAQNRQQADNMLNEFNQRLLSYPSATMLLTDWCKEHHLAKEAKITAVRDRDVIKKADSAVLAALQATSPEGISYRQVKLTCGDYVLSEADNWYVKSRLTEKMNQQLDNSDTPFGTVVKPLHFTRHNTATTMLWHPLQERSAGQHKNQYISVPEYVLQHQAILYDSQQHPFSLVIERYRHDLFRFPLQQKL